MFIWSLGPKVHEI